jgi:hypothetical protein
MSMSSAGGSITGGSWKFEQSVQSSSPPAAAAAAAAAVVAAHVRPAINTEYDEVEEISACMSMLNSPVDSSAAAVTHYRVNSGGGGVGNFMFGVSGNNDSSSNGSSGMNIPAVKKPDVRARHHARQLSQGRVRGGGGGGAFSFQ